MKHVVCISRQYASGGSEIGRRLAEALGVPLYDREIITESAKESRIDEKIVSQNDETSSLLYSLAVGNYMPWVDVAAPRELPIPDQVFLAQADTIRKFAKAGSCVIIGRCAGEVLRDLPECRKIFIFADLEFRRRRALEDGCEEKKLEERLRQTDKKRASFFNYYSNKHWGQPDSYDLALKSSVLGIDASVEAILGYLKALEGAAG